MEAIGGGKLDSTVSQSIVVAADCVMLVRIATVTPSSTGRHWTADQFIAADLMFFYSSCCFFPEMNFVDVLYQMLRDRDAQVVSNCITALSEILANEGGMVINRKIVHYLLNR